MKKKMMALLLVTAMVVGSFSVTAFASEATETAGTESEEDASQDKSTPETIEQDGEELDATEIIDMIDIDRIEITVENPWIGWTMDTYYDQVSVKVYDADGNELKENSDFSVRLGGFYSMDDSEGASLNQLSYDTKVEEGSTYGFELYIDVSNGYTYTPAETKITVNGSDASIITSYANKISANVTFTLASVEAPEDGLDPTPYYIDIPFTVEVKQTGDVAPGKETLHFDYDIDQDLNAKVSGGDVEIDGAGTYTGMFRVSLDWADVSINEYKRNFTAGKYFFIICAPELSDVCWSLESTEFYLVSVGEWIKVYAPLMEDSADSITVGKENKWGGEYTLAFVPYDVDAQDWDMTTSLSEATFVLAYAEDADDLTTDSAADTTSSAKNEDVKAKAAKTADESNLYGMLILMMAAVLVCAGTSAYRKNRR